MSLKRKRTTRERARQFLSGGGVLREDSDDELGDEDLPWQWIYDKKNDDTANDDNRSNRNALQQPGSGRPIIGARMGKFECFVGDAVLLKAPVSNEAWVAIITSFSEASEAGEGGGEEEDGGVTRQKKAQMLWFSSQAEIRNSKKKRSDFLPNELYITANIDDNALATINGKATVLSKAAFDKLYPTGKVSRGAKEWGKVFVCRRGANTRTTTYTDEFVWEDVYGGKQDLQRLEVLVKTQTVKTRKRKTVNDDNENDLEEFVVDDDPQTPRKRRKIASATPTPSKAKRLTPCKFATPTGRKIAIKRPLEFTPLGTRVLSPSHTQSSPYQLVRSTLHVSAVPHTLPCRENEFATVYSHLEAAITAGTGACIYISGTPGTGKTATVREVVASLQSAVADEQLDDFYFVEINGMKVSDPHQSYSLLWEALKGARVSPSHALELLDREFNTPSPRRVPCVVLMDELDQLVTKNQGVMYNFFNWPQLRHSRLIVLAVANTMDLPERTLSNKISSRLGLTRITFPGYTHTQLMAIITSRLQGVGVDGGVLVEPDAVQFASRKVAAVSGDARRALEICRRAVEIAEQESLLLQPAHGDPPAVVAGGKENRAPDDDPATPSKTPARVQKQQNKERQPAKSSTLDPTSPSLSPRLPSPQKQVKRVTIATIKRALQESTSTPLAASLRSLPLTSKLFLAALLARVRRTGIAESTLADVVDEARKIVLPLLTSSAGGKDGIVGGQWAYLLTAPSSAALARDTERAIDAGALSRVPGRRGRPPAAASARAGMRDGGVAARVLGVSAAARELAEAGVIGVEARHGERVGRVRLGVSEEEVRGALREDEDSALLGLGR